MNTPAALAPAGGGHIGPPFIVYVIQRSLLLDGQHYTVVQMKIGRLCDTTLIISWTGEVVGRKPMFVKILDKVVR